MSKSVCLARNPRNKPVDGNVLARAWSLMMILVFVCSVVGFTPTRVLAAGTTFYVDNTNPACSDSSSGPQGTIDVPFCSLSRGALKAVTPGDTVRVIAGTYAETVYPNSGTEANPITFLANPGVTVTGQPGTATVAYSAFALGDKSYVIIDGFNITQTSSKGIYVDQSDHIIIRNNHVSYAGASSLFHPYEQGIYLKATTDSTITNNITDHNTCIGIRLVNNSNNNLVSNNVSYSNYSVVETDAAGIEMTGSSYNTIINNITYSNEDSGINLYSNSGGVPSSYNLVIGNLSYENGDHGIDHYSSPYNTVVGNTVHGNGTVGINFEGPAGSGSHTATVANNIIVANGFTPPDGSFGGNLRVDSNSITGTVLDYNLFDNQDASVQIIWSSINYTSLAAFQAAETSQEPHGLEADPLFVAPVPPAVRQSGVPYEGAGLVGDYGLKSGSPAIDSANADAPGERLNDILGNSRIDDPSTPDTGTGARTYDDRGALEFQPEAANTLADVHVYIGGDHQDNYLMPAGSSVRDNYTRINAGPVKVTSTNHMPIMTAERVIYKVNGVNTSFTEMMALPDNQLDRIYWLPWYNNRELDTQLRFGNVSETGQASVRVYIGGKEISGCTSAPAMAYPYVLDAGKSVRVSCPKLNSGPVQIVSDIPIVAAERVVYKVNGIDTSFSEMMALPDNQLDRIYWLPWYNNKDLDTQLRFGNVSETGQASVRVYIGGKEISGCTSAPAMAYPYVLDAGKSVRVSCPKLNSGPVQIVSDIPIVAAERVIYKVNGVDTSFTEMMALPERQLDTMYWLPWYNNKDLDTQLRFGNVSETGQASVRVYIGGKEISGCTSAPAMAYPYVLDAGKSVRVRCPNLSKGPVKIVSDIPIVAAERVVYKVNGIDTSFSEMMALPNGLLDTMYWLPWYNNRDLDTQLRFATP